MCLFRTLLLINFTGPESINIFFAYDFQNYAVVFVCKQDKLLRETMIAKNIPQLTEFSLYLVSFLTKPNVATARYILILATDA